MAEASLQNPLVNGLIIGSRKCGTTWLYQNFLKDPNLRTGELVKESSYFTGETNLNPTSYEQLFEGATGVHTVEVDTTICDSKGACSRILEYNENMSVVLLFREPIDFLKSRFAHGIRKGEFDAADCVAALDAAPWLGVELDYQAILDEFAPLVRKGQLTVLAYADLVADPTSFYKKATGALGVESDHAYTPFLQAVNVARDTHFPFLSSVLSNGAIAARRMGAHKLVNLLKGTGVLGLLERPLERSAQEDQRLEDAQIARAITERYPYTLPLYQKLVGGQPLWP